MNCRTLRTPATLGILMLIAAAVTIAATPTIRLADSGPKLKLETVIPDKFGEWRVDPTIVPIAVSPDVQARLDKIYDQTLSRTYLNASGRRVMLSVAYGGDQSDGMRAHRPEVCYAAQGFEVGSMAKGLMMLADERLPVMRLVARQQNRIEPITYWHVVGDQVATTGLEQKLAQLRYGITGVIPDGILMRVSSIGADSKREFELHEQFTADLLSSVDGAFKVRLVGKVS